MTWRKTHDRESSVKSTDKFVLKVKRGMYRVVDRDCNPVSPIPCPDHVDEIWGWGPGNEYECFKLELGKTYYFEEAGRWTYTELVGNQMEGLEVMPAPLKYVPRCRERGVE